MDCMQNDFLDNVLLDGRFSTIRPLNHGSFGMVFMAKDLTNDETVAIKCLTKKSAINDPSLASEFSIDENSEELACHARLGSHPNIVNLIHSFETDAHVYLVLEYCQNGDLYEAIRLDAGPSSTEHVREFMLQLIDAVAYIHSKGLYHRDIKPENIFLTKSGILKLGDFGLATQDFWSYEVAVGSDRYMSPEQYDSFGAGYSTASADVWAIGVCLLNILFKRNPFTTPTESDPLFADFAGDKQSLFDVFTNMSMDTFEIISQCMSLDPTKRSLSAAREAIVRAVAFTTDEEVDDDFLNINRPVMASSNREPLRTPSLQSPQVDNGSFPWAKHLHASPPQVIRQLSAIPDTESYSEDLFPSSEDSNKDWFSLGQQTPSTSILGSSAFGASMMSMAIRRPVKVSPPQADLTPISGSLPIAMTKPKPIPSLSSVFGRKNDMVSKSWSEMYEEDTEEDEIESQIKDRQANNARTWSHESNTVTVNNVTPRQGLSEPKTSSFVNMKALNNAIAQAGKADVDGDINDGFFFEDHVQPPHYSPPRYSPPPKRTTVDKWAALGERRRAYTGTRTTDKTSDNWRGRRSTQNQSSTGFNGFGHGIWDIKANNSGRTGCPWGWGREREQQASFKTENKKPHGDFADFEWVGGWKSTPDLHL